METVDGGDINTVWDNMAAEKTVHRFFGNAFGLIHESFMMPLRTSVAITHNINRIFVFRTRRLPPTQNKRLFLDLTNPCTYATMLGPGCRCKPVQTNAKLTDNYENNLKNNEKNINKLRKMMSRVRGASKNQCKPMQN